ncbi:MAG: HAD hydrolase-like protein [Lachnospiraceae bacterium]|nr:HAD hydrolase-like protein [Lachnospiraceae bacterium]
MYQYVLFDLDGTLTDSKPGILNCIQYALEKLGRPESDRDKLNCYLGPPLQISFQKYGGFDSETAIQATEIYRERFSTIGLFENCVFDGVIPMMKKLKKAGKMLAVATSKPKIYTDRILEKYELDPYFSVVVGSELDGTLSDKAEVVAEVFRQLFLTEADRAKAVMVGDREYDMTGAIKNKIDCIGVRYGYSEGDELERAGATYLVDTVSDLEKFLLSHE